MPLHHLPYDPRNPSAGAPLVVYGLRRRARHAAQNRQLVQAGIWLLGVAGFLAPMIMARTSAHADLLRAGALGWFILFGIINGVFVFRAFPRRRLPHDRSSRR